MNSAATVCVHLILKKKRRQYLVRQSGELLIIYIYCVCVCVCVCVSGCIRSERH